VGGGSGELGELLAGLLKDADAGGAALGGEVQEAGVMTGFKAFPGQQHVVKTAAACAKSFFNRVNAIEDFHEDSLVGQRVPEESLVLAR